MKNEDLVSSIDSIRLAVLESFWIGNLGDIPTENTSVWCEFWLRFDAKTDDDNVISDFVQLCSEFQIPINQNRIVFPERLVVLANVNRSQLKSLISTCAYIAEIRRAPEVATFFDNLNLIEQQNWCDDLISRTRFINSNATVCILDTGVSREHPLIEPYTNIQHVQTVDESWNMSDKDGHGTTMAGIALYYDSGETRIL